MTLHTPVVLTDDPGIAAEARRRHWPVVRRDGHTLHLTGVAQTAPLPEPSMRIEHGSLDAAHAAGWKFVLDWVEKHVHRPMLVVEPNGYAQDLALWSASSRRWPVGAWVSGTAPVVAAAGAVALLSSSVGVLSATEDDRERLLAGWRSRVEALSDDALVEVSAPRAPLARPRQAGVTRVLLVAYDSGDRPTVGVQRPTYWFETLEELAGGAISVDLATATPWTDQPERVHLVPDHGAATLAPGRGPIEPWAAVAMSHAADKAYAPTRHTGGYWQVALERWFESRDDHYDVVILTGDPCEYFGFASFAQRHWYARTILHHDDPSALTSRTTGEAHDQAVDAALGWNLAADVITVRAEEQRGQVVGSGPDMRIETVGDSDPGRVLALVRELGDRSFGASQTAR